MDTLTRTKWKLVSTKERLFHRSRLLWVIYIDPLLTVLNNEAQFPYITNSDPTLQSVATSTLAYMDDTTLISSSIEGLTQMLTIAQEFYVMNNTKINFNKAELICNRNPLDTNIIISGCPEPFNFTSPNINFTCMPLPYN